MCGCPCPIRTCIGHRCADMAQPKACIGMEHVRIGAAGNSLRCRDPHSRGIMAEVMAESLS